jgi:hypothetical protein
MDSGRAIRIASNPIEMTGGVRLSLGVRATSRLRLTRSRLRRRTALALLVVSAAIAPAVEINAPARNWVLPVFTKEGYRSMTARGSEARVLPNRQFQVVDLNLTLFSGDPAATVETVILSPEATFVPDAKTAHGEKNVRFIRDEVEASGIRWTYRENNRKISLDGDVHVTFHAEIKDLLK